MGDSCEPLVVCGNNCFPSRTVIHSPSTLTPRSVIGLAALAATKNNTVLVRTFNFLLSIGVLGTKYHFIVLAPSSLDAYITSHVHYLAHSHSFRITSHVRESSLDYKNPSLYVLSQNINSLVPTVCLSLLPCVHSLMSRQHSEMPEPPLVLSVIHFCTCTVSLVCGSTLFYIATRHTPVQLRSYAVLIRG